MKFHRPDEGQDAGGTLLQLHEPAAMVLPGRAVKRTRDPPCSGLETTTGTPADAANPPVGFGIYDRNRTGCLIVGCRDETYLRIRSVKQENRALLEAREWWNGVVGAGDRPIKMSKLA